ncbi:MAG: stage III sporulation protein AE, partial [Desulfobacterales bacterium]|nr:stage III sporulation protein AE [Desulfobacterales bacterium]
MIKKIMSLLIITILCFGISSNIYAEDEVKQDATIILDEMLDELSLEKVNSTVDQMLRDIYQILPGKSFSGMVREFVSNGFKFDWQEVLSNLMSVFFQEIFINIKLLGQLLVLVVIASMLKLFQDAFNGTGVAKLSNGVIYLSLIIIALNTFSIASQVGSKAIGSMVDFMHSILPTLFALLISLGAVGSATIFQPIIFLVVSMIGTAIKTLVLPLISLAIVISVVSSFTGEFKLSRLSSFIKEIGVTILGLSFIIFFGVILIQGVGVSVADGISLRTAKYLTGAFIPIVGGMFADALELVVGCSLLIQNGIGLIGMLVIFITVLFPIIKILALVFIYKLISAVIEPIGEQVIVDCLNNLGNTLMLVFLSLTTVAI